MSSRARRAAAAVALAVAVNPTTGAGFCPEVPVDSLTIDGVQDLLSKWNLNKALGAEFREQDVDGFKLDVLAMPDALDKDAYPNAQPFDWIALRKHLAECSSKALPAALSQEYRRRMTGVMAPMSGLKIKKPNGGVGFGKHTDVSISRSGNGTLLVNASQTDVSGDLDVFGDLMVEGHLVLNVGNVSAANIDDLVDSTTNLWSQIGRAHV